MREITDMTQNLDAYFKKPYITDYGFMRLLAAKLSPEFPYSFTSEAVVKKIYELSKNPKYKKLLNEIGFQVSIDNITSKEIEGCIASLKTFNMIGKLNPASNKTYILMNAQKADSIVKEYENDVVELMDGFVEDFKKLKV